MILTDEEIDEQLRLLNERKNKLMKLRKAQAEVDYLEARTVVADTDTKKDVCLIRSIVMEHYGLTLQEVNSNCKAEYITRPRQMMFYLCRFMTKSTLSEIGRMFGKDHGTVLCGVRRTRDFIDTMPGFKATVEMLQAKCVKMLAAPRGETETRK